MNEKVLKDFSANESDIRKQIEHINLRQVELAKHIVTLEMANDKLGVQLTKEKDADARARIYASIRSNLQLIVELNDIYKEYEQVKSSYFKALADSIYRKHHLLIDIRRLQERADNSEVLDTLTSLLSGKKSEPVVLFDEDEKLKYNL